MWETRIYIRIHVSGSIRLLRIYTRIWPSIPGRRAWCAYLPTRLPNNIFLSPPPFPSTISFLRLSGCNRERRIRARQGQELRLLRISWAQPARRSREISGVYISRFFFCHSQEKRGLEKGKEGSQGTTFESFGSENICINSLKTSRTSGIRGKGNWVWQKKNHALRL